jgi:hypothetical protein
MPRWNGRSEKHTEAFDEKLSQWHFIFRTNFIRLPLDRNRVSAIGNFATNDMRPTKTLSLIFSLCLSLLSFSCHPVLAFELTVTHSFIITVVIMFRMTTINDNLSPIAIWPVYYQTSSLLVSFLRLRFLGPHSLFSLSIYGSNWTPCVRAVAVLATRHRVHLLLPLQQTNTEQ